MGSFIYGLLIISLVLGNIQANYRAVVVEYAINYDNNATPFQNIQHQIDNIIKYTAEAAAKKAQIVVFPEASITSLETMNKIREHLKTYSILIPDENFNPCLNKTEKSMHIYSLSCAAKNNNIYIVVNLLERTNSSDYSLYNTAVVFSNSGEIIAKYRTLNTAGNKELSPGNMTVTFKTSFNVKFGILTGIDMLFKNPALDILKGHNVTDLILISAFKSNLPFNQALSIQSGYASAFGLNVLAANLYDDKAGTSGSGIYLANETSIVHVSNYAQTKLIVQNVPKPPKRQFGCESKMSKKQYIIDETSQIKEYKFSTENLTYYAQKDIKITAKETKYEICSGKFCCQFTITLNPNNINSNVIYKIIANDVSDTRFNINNLRNQTCALVQCQTKDINTCGIGLGEPSVKFNSIVLTVKINKGDFLLPITLNDRFVPLDNYRYCSKDLLTSQYEVTMETMSPTEGVNTFGVYTSVYSNDSNSGNKLFANLFISSVAIITLIRNML